LQKWWETAVKNAKELTDDALFGNNIFPTSRLSTCNIFPFNAFSKTLLKKTRPKVGKDVLAVHTNIDVRNISLDTKLR